MGSQNPTPLIKAAGRQDSSGQNAFVVTRFRIA
jgi:hypothetical protein